jgi:hypothetical protein
LEPAQLLLQYGADTNVVNNDNDTAIVEILKNNGAKDL